MGPYCNYCNTRCFKPTTKDSLITKDLEPTCKEGLKHAMDVTYPKLINKQNNQVGWLVELRRHDGTGHSLAAELINSQVMTYEISNHDIEEILDFLKAPGENRYFKVIR